MSQLVISDWWKAKGIPLAESDWSNIKLYCDEQSDPWSWTDCIYFFRLAAPYTINYAEKRTSPSIYVGSGAIQQRWNNHLKDWISGLAHWLPGGRYEIWLFRHKQYKDVEADALKLFLDFYKHLPLANRIGGKSELNFEYPDNHKILEVADQDKRYWWAITPLQDDVVEYFKKGAIED